MRGKVSIIGRGNNKLEAELLSNGDFSVGVTNTDRKTIYADFPNPINGGGDSEVY